MANRTLQMWIGNLDDVRRGFVSPLRRRRAVMQIIGNSSSNFEDYWTLQQAVDQTLTPKILYWCPMDWGPRGSTRKNTAWRPVKTAKVP